MKLIIFFLAFYPQVSVYSFKLTAANGSPIDFNNFRGKAILIVNIATNSPMNEQIGQLEQLHRKHKDSLVIVAFPSDSFGNEPKNNNQIIDFCTGMYNTSFYIAEKASVTGADAQSFYSWISEQAQNGMMNNATNGDFKKYLVNKNGKLVGVFSSRVKPTDQTIEQALRY